MVQIVRLLLIKLPLAVLTIPFAIVLGILLVLVFMCGYALGTVSSMFGAGREASEDFGVHVRGLMAWLQR